MAILNEKPRTATRDHRRGRGACCVIDAKTLETMISNNSEIAFRLIKKLAKRLDAVDELVQILLNPDPEARVMLGLKRHAESFGEEGESGEIVLHISAEELAMEVGAKPAHVHDVLRRLGRLHIAGVTQDETIMVADIGRLLEFLEFVDVPRKSVGRGRVATWSSRSSAATAGRRPVTGRARSCSTTASPSTQAR